MPAAVLTLVYPEAAEWFPEIAGFRIFRIPLPSHSLQARMAPADSVAADAKPDANSVTTPSIDAAAANSNPRTIQRQVAAATALAEHVTAATAPAGRSEAIRPGDAEKTAPASSSNTDHLVALLMARPHIKSVSALSGKDIAIDDGRSASSGSVRTAIAAAGAVAAQLSEGQTKAVDRLLSGEVSAAVLTLASAEAAEWFPDIAGFKIFRVPLSPRSLQARLEPAGNADAKSDARLVAAPSPEAGAAANSNTRAIQRQVTAATVVAEHVMALRDAEKAASASQGNKDLVALVMARPDIKSISDLAGKDVAIDDRHSASSGKVKTAIAAAGAAVELSEGQTKALDRLLGGEVPAAILTLVYPETGFADIAGFRIFRVPLSPRALQPRLETAGNAAAKSDAKPETRPVTAPAKIAAPAINPSARTIRQQVAAATALAEHVTASMAPLQKADNAGVSGRTGAAQPDEPESTASVPPDSTERLIALLMARAEITSVSDLTGKEVAIGDEQSAYSRSVRNAIAAAGAPEVRLSGANATAIDRLIGGEVPAAVLTLVSPEAAEWFPDIAGFRIFRVPLSPRSLKARL